MACRHRIDAQDPDDTPTVKPRLAHDKPDHHVSYGFRLSRADCGWIALLGLLFVYLSHQPLYHTDLWGHLAYGRWIWEHGTLPQTEPLLPLSQGVPMVDTAWLSQVVGFGMCRQFGVTALQLLYAVPITAAFGVLLWGVLRRTHGSVLAGLLSVGGFGWVDYQQLLIVRPQLAGLTLFVAMFVLLNVCCWRWWFWIVVPLTFSLWANLHGSWIVGLGLLGAFCLGAAIDVAWRTKRVGAVLATRRVRRWFPLTLLAALAVLINPYGDGVYTEVFAIAGNPNVHDLIEWKPLTLHMSQGRAAATATVGLIVVMWFSPRRVRATEVLLLVGLGVAALWSSRMIHWWAPLAAYYLAVHAAGVWRHRQPTSTAKPNRTGLATVVTAVLACICFVCTPFGSTLLRSQPETPDERSRLISESTSTMTPVSAVGYLHDHPVQGLIFNRYAWGDFLLFAGPGDIQLFTNSHAHLIPREVWKDSIVIEHATDGWDDKLEQYKVEALVLNVHTDATLVEALGSRPETWRLAFEDRTTVIFRRRNAD